MNLPRRRLIVMKRLLLLSALLPALAVAAPHSLAERLGYPKDAKLLILHADDLGVAHSENAASLDALDKGAVNSGSIMMPTPWVTENAEYAKRHPNADLGLHLTLNSEWQTYRWGGVAPRDQVPSLYDPDGTFPRETPTTATRAKQDEVELADLPITPAQIGELQQLVDAGRINDKIARQVLDGVLAGEGGPEEVVVARGLEVVSDDGPLLEAIDAALAAQPDVVEKVRGGNQGPVGAIIGAVMKATRGQADAKRVRELVLERIG